MEKEQLPLYYECLSRVTTRVTITESTVPYRPYRTVKEVHPSTSFIDLSLPSFLQSVPNETSISVYHCLPCSELFNSFKAFVIFVYKNCYTRSRQEFNASHFVLLVLAADQSLFQSIVNIYSSLGCHQHDTLTPLQPSDSSAFHTIVHSGVWY